MYFSNLFRKKLQSYYINSFAVLWVKIRIINPTTIESIELKTISLGYKYKSNKFQIPHQTEITTVPINNARNKWLFFSLYILFLIVSTI